MIEPQKRSYFRQGTLVSPFTFEVAMSLVAKNPEFRELHNYYTTRRLNPLKKMQSLMAIAAKLIRVFYVMLTKGVDYDSKKMVSDIKRPAVYLQAA